MRDKPTRDSGLRGIVTREVSNQHTGIEADQRRNARSVAASAIASLISSIVSRRGAGARNPNNSRTEPFFFAGARIIRPSDETRYSSRSPGLSFNRFRISCGIVV
jgi:hypothetical protein